MRKTPRIAAVTLVLAFAGCAGSQSAQRPAGGVGTTPVRRERIPLSERNRVLNQEKSEQAFDHMTRVEGAVVR